MLRALNLYLRHTLPARWRNARLIARLEREWRQAAPALRQRGGADSGVVVSLTSYPPRFPTLHLTLKSLLMQSVRARAVQLWIAHNDMAQLPPDVLALVPYGLEIRACDDLRSYKKLIPALATQAGHAIVTADDDIYYWRDWLRELVEAQVPGQAAVICHRMHRIRLAPDGAPMPYDEWQFDIRGNGSDPLNFPTGIGGVLYPPGIFGAQAVTDIATFTALCPNGDDIWFYWMARMNGATFKRTATDSPLYCWEGSQDAALWKNNLVGKYNDTQIAAMIDRFGFFDERRIA